MKALYRKYRPTKLEDVVGQPQVTDILSKNLKSDKISHAYLFTGPRGCGKTSVARIFAHEINNFDYQLEDEYVDIIEIDAASNTSVDNIRELRERATIAPTVGKYKVYIIDEIHMLSKSAFNALLKTLEEPPEHVIFIMATTDVYKVPQTIISRSQVFQFKLADNATIFKHIKSLAKSENIDITDEAIEIIIHRGGGSFRDTISLLDQLSSIKTGQITKQDIMDSLGLPDDQVINNLLEAYENADLSTISDSLKTLINNGVKPEILASEIIAKILENPKPAYIPLLSTLTEVGSPFAEAKLLLSFTEVFAKNPVLASPTPTVSPTPATTPAPTPQVPTPQTTPTPQATSTTTPTSELPQQETPTPQPTNSTFDWQTYLENVKTSSMPVYNALNRAKYQLENDKLLIGAKRVFKRILESPQNLKVLQKHLPANYTLKIVDLEDITKKDPTISQISDIMGGNIEENDGDIPF
ncbi:DNA polymerase III subunit gamma/tau [Candidatus Saccharibacteria bacterium]|nr:DNA polymerase III subunit gamma/tau [Candidatus Saccharibacteria bacterium]